MSEWVSDLIHFNVNQKMMMVVGCWCSKCLYELLWVILCVMLCVMLWVIVCVVVCVKVCMVVKVVVRWNYWFYAVLYLYFCVCNRRGSKHHQSVVIFVVCFSASRAKNFVCYTSENLVLQMSVCYAFRKLVTNVCMLYFRTTYVSHKCWSQRRNRFQKKDLGSIVGVTLWFSISLWHVSHKC